MSSRRVLWATWTAYCCMNQGGVMALQHNSWSPRSPMSSTTWTSRSASLPKSSATVNNPLPLVPRRVTIALQSTTSSSSSSSSSSSPLSSSSVSTASKKDDNSKNAWRLAIAMYFSQRNTARTKNGDSTFNPVGTAVERRAIQIYTFLRVSVPAVLAGFLATILFPALAIGMATMMNDAGVFTVLSTDSSQFVQNFVSVASLLFSMLVGQTYYFMYQQTEQVYYALFNEVTEAKSLLEQVALVCQGRSMYSRCLECIYKYVEDDLKQLQADPAELLSARPSEDPLESIMYMTSVGVPSTVYETVKSLRQARAARLGSLQRKLPKAHIWLLWVLAGIELLSFPLLGAGTQVIGGYRILTVEGILFGVMTSGIVLTLQVVKELWRPAGGAYNVDSVLSTMVSGLEEELLARRAGTKIYGASQKAPSAANEMNGLSHRVSRVDANDDDINNNNTTLPVFQQGGNAFQATRKLLKWMKDQAQQRSRTRLD